MSTMKPIEIEVDEREFDTVLAALRYYQQHVPSECEQGRLLSRCRLIAGEHGVPLNDEEIDRLCIRIN